MIISKKKQGEVAGCQGLTLRVPGMAANAGGVCKSLGWDLDSIRATYGKSRHRPMCLHFNRSLNTYASRGLAVLRSFGLSLSSINSCH